MSNEAQTVVKFVCYVVGSFITVAALHGLVPSVALLCGVALASVVLVLIGLSKDEPLPYAVVALAALIALGLGWG